MTRVRKLARDSRGMAAVEFALALPVLVLFIYGIFVIGMVFMASAGIHHALGEASRYATLFPTPTDQQIEARIRDSVFGVGNGTFSTPTIDTNTTDHHKTITLTYSQPTHFIFFRGPNITLRQAKRVYIAY